MAKQADIAAMVAAAVAQAMAQLNQTAPAPTAPAPTAPAPTAPAMEKFVAAMAAATNDKMRGAETKVSAIMEFGTAVASVTDEQASAIADAYIAKLEVLGRPLTAGSEKVRKAEVTVLARWAPAITSAVKAEKVKKNESEILRFARNLKIAKGDEAAALKAMDEKSKATPAEIGRLVAKIGDAGTASPHMMAMFVGMCDTWGIAIPHGEKWRNPTLAGKPRE